MEKNTLLEPKAEEHIMGKKKMKLPIEKALGNSDSRRGSSDQE